MQLELAYGTTGIPVTVPDGAEATVIRKNPLPVLPDADAAVRAALDAPVGCLPLV